MSAARVWGYCFAQSAALSSEKWLTPNFGSLITLDMREGLHRSFVSRVAIISWRWAESQIFPALLRGSEPSSWRAELRMEEFATASTIVAPYGVQSI